MRGAVRAASIGFLVLLALLLSPVSRAEAKGLAVGSKAFTEGVILGEIATRLCADGAGEPVEHRRQLGGSVIVFRALESGAIDAYVEYSGTLAKELLHLASGSDTAALRAELGRRGIVMGEPLGFDNTYALAMRESLAKERGFVRTSDLAKDTSLVFGLSHEIVARADGWPGLRDRYALVPRELRAMDHDVAYRAVGAGSIDVTDVYTTDAEIPSLGLRVLDDDRAYFPAYRAVILRRSDLATRAPGCVRGLERLEGRVDAAAMRAMNAAVKIDHATEDAVAAKLVNETFSIASRSSGPGLTARLVVRTQEHLVLTFASLLMAVVVGLPLGVACAKMPRLKALVLGVAGVVQTVPSLALLVLFLPLFGIGTAPALAALVLYSLFPVIEGTVTGLTTIDPALSSSADALGLPRWGRLRDVDLPLASPSIVSGIRTSAVLAVGTATLGAMVGAGGYGQAILTGIRLDSVPMVLEGALPAAALSLIVQAVFRWAERKIVPKGLLANTTPGSP